VLRLISGGSVTTKKGTIIKYLFVSKICVLNMWNFVNILRAYDDDDDDIIIIIIIIIITIIF
jgi:hypothetical protein